MFISHNKVRVHDTDMAGILYFPKQFRFAHDALEDFLLSFGMTYQKIFYEKFFVFVVVHAEADYMAPLLVGDVLEVHVTIGQIGTTSFTVCYDIYKKDKTLVGRVKTVHVTLDNISRKKIPIPSELRVLLEKHSV